MNEVWKPVVGFEGVYEVSDQGRIRRILAARGFAAGRLVKPLPQVRGYVKVTLCHLKRKRQVMAHTVVAEAFLGPIPPGHQVNHKSGDKTDNRPENLEYVTARQNMRHMYDVLETGNLGSKNGSAKLTRDDVLEVRAMRARGMTQKAIADHFGLSDRTIGEIVRGEIWKHV